MRGQLIRARQDIPLLQLELKTKHSKTLKLMERTSRLKALLTTIMAEPVERGWHPSSALPSNARRFMERFWRSSISPITETTMFANFSLLTTATSLNAILARESRLRMRPLVILYILLWILSIGYFLRYYILNKVKAIPGNAHTLNLFTRTKKRVISLSHSSATYAFENVMPNEVKVLNWRWRNASGTTSEMRTAAWKE